MRRASVGRTSGQIALVVGALVAGACGRLAFRQRVAADASGDAALDPQVDPVNDASGDVASHTEDVVDAGRDAAETSTADVLDAGALDADALDADALDVTALDASTFDVGDADDSDRGDAACSCPFGPPTLVPNVNSTEDDYDPAISADGLTLVLASFRTTGTYLHISERVRTSDPFPPASLVPDPTGLCACRDPSLTADGRMLTFWAGSPFITTRADRTSPWSSARPLRGELAMHTVGEVGITSDGLSVLFSNLDTFTPEASLMIATRIDTMSEFTGGRAIDELTTPLTEHRPRLSADGRSLIFETRGATTTMYEARRSTPSERFGREEAVAIPGATEASDGTLTADRRTLYFAMERPDGLGLRDIWVSERSCVCE